MKDQSIMIEIATSDARSFLSVCIDITIAIYQSPSQTSNLSLLSLSNFLSNPRPGKLRWMSKRNEKQADAASPQIVARTQEAILVGRETFAGREAFSGDAEKKKRSRCRCRTIVHEKMTERQSDGVGIQNQLQRGDGK